MDYNQFLDKEVKAESLNIMKRSLESIDIKTKSIQEKQESNIYN